MRLATLEIDGREAGAILAGERAFPLPAGVSVLDALGMSAAQRADLEAEAVRGPGRALADHRLLAPIAPRAMRDFVAFEEHVVGVSRSVDGTDAVADAWYDAPAFVFMNPHSLIGAHDDMPKPPLTEALDFELEIAAIVAADCRDLTVEQARENIAGYCILNDWSARDVQRREMQVGLGPSKGKDFANTLGPWITTADELDEHHRDGVLDLEMTVAINGRIVGRDRSGHMAWSFAELLAHASRGARVGAGDVIASGTCHTGALAEIWGRTGRREPAPLEPGDTVTMTIEHLGTISNRVVPPTSPGHRVPRARAGVGAAAAAAGGIR
ncbi:fumarylacetoacetate hydrolase family protein [Gordonia sp. NPDC003424]